MKLSMTVVELQTCSNMMAGPIIPINSACLLMMAARSVSQLPAR